MGLSEVDSSGMGLIGEMGIDWGQLKSTIWYLFLIQSQINDQSNRFV